MSIISITDKGKTITYHAHHMRDVIEPVKQYGMFGEQLNAKKKLHTLTFYTEDYYRGEVGVILRNMGEHAFEVHEGDRIAQIVFLPYAHMQFKPVNELDSTERGEKGFGSSGK